MKKAYGILLLVAFAIGTVFFACSNQEKCATNPELCPESSDSGEFGDSSDSDSGNNSRDDSSDSGNFPGDDSSDSSNIPDEDSSDSAEKTSSSSRSSNSGLASSSSIATTPSSSSPVAGTSSATPSSSSKAASSSAAVIISNCVEPQNSVPPGGITSCIIVNGKCYTCNPERGNDCNQGWIWNGGNASGDAYWYKEVSCNGSIGGTSSSAGTVTTSSNSGGGGTSSNSGGNGTPSYTPTAPGNETSKLTHYWDACKPSCSWSTNFGGGKQANACNINGSNIGHNDMDKSACDNGTAFMCMNQAPWKVGNVSFGYVAAAVGSCGDCYQFDFPNGQVMVVMANNHGNIHEGAKFDLMVPGGGVGDFNALTRQIQQIGSVSNPDMGERYGGFRGACGWSYSSAAANCVKQKCEDVFKNLPELKAGCLWYVNTLGTDEASWNNPTVKYKKVDCPSELTSKY